MRFASSMVDVFAAHSLFQPPSILSLVAMVSSVSPEAIVYVLPLVFTAAGLLGVVAAGAASCAGAGAGAGVLGAACSGAAGAGAACCVGAGAAGAAGAGAAAAGAAPLVPLS